MQQIPVTKQLLLPCHSMVIHSTYVTRPFHVRIVIGSLATLRLRMSKEIDTDTPAAESGFACGIEASTLLNCVASKQYSEAKCKPLLQKLRSCIEKKV